MKNSILLMAIAIIFTLFASSCSKEEVAQQAYPEEITLNNWEKFVDAPQDVREQAIAQYRQKHANKGGHSLPDDIHNQKNTCSSGYIGWVKAWNGNGWAGIEDVVVSSPGYVVLTSNTNSPGRYVGCQDHPETCMSYHTSQTNGVDVGDMVTIRRHILGYEHFNDVNHPNFTTADNAARKYVASDVNYDGFITDDDIDLIQDVILGIATFPENVVFVPMTELDLYELSTNPASLSAIGFSTCRQNSNNHIQNWFRYAIKRGDASGDFSF